MHLIETLELHMAKVRKAMDDHRESLKDVDPMEYLTWEAEEELLSREFYACEGLIEIQLIRSGKI